MAGQRFRPPGWTEISAVCTAQEFRGRGLAKRLVYALAYEIRQRGERPFLHVVPSDTKAIALYQTLALGFAVLQKYWVLGRRVLQLSFDANRCSEPNQGSAETRSAAYQAGVMP
jgi:ribosomal protein S18 acetylase RimI-like enzyme